MEQEREIRMAYAQVNYAFLLVEDMSMQRFFLHVEEEGVFRQLPEVDSERNRFGICGDLYLLLLMYEGATGNVLTYETVLDYFSQEYEPDGSLRLHNNSRHPEIHAFVEWMWKEYRWWDDFRAFINSIDSVHWNYSRDNPYSEVYNLNTHAMSPQMLRELAHAANNPEYLDELDLTGLQQAGY